MPYGSLLADTIKSSVSGPVTFQNTSGTEIGTLCRAWVNFNGTGTVAIRGSFNVSSITDLAAGEYQVNFTTAMADANYCTNVTGSTNSAYDSDGFTFADVLSNLTTPHATTTYVRVGTAVAANGNGADTGAVSMNVSVFR
jgi:hypothetical protein